MTPPTIRNKDRDLRAEEHLSIRLNFEPQIFLLV